MKQEKKLFLRSAANVSGNASKYFAVGSLIAYLIGAIISLLLDRDEIIEVNNKRNK